MSSITLKELCAREGYKPDFMKSIVCRDAITPFRAAGPFYVFNDTPEFRQAVKNLIKLKLKSVHVRAKFY